MGFKHEFEILLSGLISKSDIEVETAAIEFFAAIGFKVDVVRMPKNHLGTDSGRQFVIKFENEGLAINFANCVRRPTWGFGSLLLEV